MHFDKQILKCDKKLKKHPKTGFRITFSDYQNVSFYLNRLFSSFLLIRFLYKILERFITISIYDRLLKTVSLNIEIIYIRSGGPHHPKTIYYKT